MARGRVRWRRHAEESVEMEHGPQPTGQAISYAMELGYAIRQRQAGEGSNTSAFRCPAERHALQGHESLTIDMTIILVILLTTMRFAKQGQADESDAGWERRGLGHDERVSPEVAGVPQMDRARYSEGAFD